MVLTFIAALLLYLVWTAIRLQRRRAPQTAQEFFSFGGSATPSGLRDAFFVTNASFATAFVSLFLFVSTQGSLAFITPLAFVAGCLLFSQVLVRRALPLMATGKRYPQLLGELAGSRSVRLLASTYVIASLWLFTYTELQGFLAFTRAGTPETVSPIFPLLIAVPVLLFLGFYTARSGFSGVVASDKAQRVFIIAGALSFILLSVSQLYIPEGSIITTGVKIPEPYAGSMALVFGVDTLVGFLFAQTIYYDNWQRISAYHGVRKNMGASDKIILSEVKSSYNEASLWLLALYSVPIILALVAQARGYAITDVPDLVRYLGVIWESTWWAKVLLAICFVYLAAALVSTAEVYIISIVNNLLDDVADVMKLDTSSESKALLPLARVVSYVAALTFIPAILIEPDFKDIFVYLFYSANGFVGPILMMLMGRKVSAAGVIVSLAFCASWPALTSLIPQLAEFVLVPGLATVAFSIVVSFAWSRPLVSPEVSDEA